MAPSLAESDVFEPNLPGWRPRPAKPATFFKPQTLIYANGGSNVESLPSQREREARAQEKAEEEARRAKAEGAAKAAAISKLASSSSSSVSSSSSFPAPRYVANAGVVLRYRGWFSEPVPAGSSRLEAKGGVAVGAGAPSFSSPSSPSPSSPAAASASASANGVRIRQIELRLYLEDNTADVVERRVVNSGLEQGLIVRRHALTRRDAKKKAGSLAPKTTKPNAAEENAEGNDADPFVPRARTEDDAPLGPEDIRVGDVLEVFGRTITIADADAATRAWLAERALSPSSSPSSSTSSSSPLSSSSPSSPFAGLPGDAIPVPEGDYEVAMRAAAAARELGKARRCAEISNETSGARLWDRLPVPAGGWKPAPKAPGEEDPRSIMARLFDGAGDRAAAAKAAAAAGSSSSAVAVPTKSRPPLPPHTGFGSEEDSANSCLGLTPRARVRRAPPAADAGVELRFSARMAGPELIPGACQLEEGDAGRGFSVRWTPADGAVSVVEERAPGYPGGKFLERNPVRRPACACNKGNDNRGGGGGFRAAAPGISACGACGGGESSSSSSSLPSSSPPSYYSEPDFYVGAPLRLHGRGFVLLTADEPALRRMESAKHPLAAKEKVAAEARTALEAAAAEASKTSEVAFAGSDLLREALAAVALQKQEKEAKEQQQHRSKDEKRRGGNETSSSSSSSLLLLTPEELGSALAAAGAPLRGPPQLQITLTRALGGNERPGNRVNASEVVERLFVG